MDSWRTLFQSEVKEKNKLDRQQQRKDAEETGIWWLGWCLPVALSDIAGSKPGNVIVFNLVPELLSAEYVCTNVFLVKGPLLQIYGALLLQGQLGETFPRPSPSPQRRCRAGDAAEEGVRAAEEARGRRANGSAGGAAKDAAETRTGSRHERGRCGSLLVPSGAELGRRRDFGGSPVESG